MHLQVIIRIKKSISGNFFDTASRDFARAFEVEKLQKQCIAGRLVHMLVLRGFALLRDRYYKNANL